MKCTNCEKKIVYRMYELETDRKQLVERFACNNVECPEYGISVEEPTLDIENLRVIQNFGEQHPQFHSNDMITYRRNLKRLEYLRKELRAERMSYGELAELQSLKEYIDKADVELLEAAGVPEFE